MSETTATVTNSERTYRHAYGALSGLSGLVLSVLVVLGHPIVGVGGFVALFALAGYLRARYPGPLFDERDNRAHERAAGRTLALFGWACAVFFPTMTVLVALGYATWPTWLVPIAFVVPVVYGVYGILLLVDR